LTIKVEGLQVFLIGNIDSKTVRDFEISIFSDKLLFLSTNPFDFKIYKDGVRVIVDVEYQGIVTNNFVIGKFLLKYIN